MARPPTIHTLLDDPVYRKMLLTPPRIPAALSWGEPWLLWAQREDGVWGSKTYATYKEVWAAAVPLIKNTAKYADVAIVSKRVLLPPPPGATWSFSLDWCSRCRRPSSFRPWDMATHHALRKAHKRSLLTYDEPYRCWYCGIRRVAMPEYSGR